MKSLSSIICEKLKISPKTKDLSGLDYSLVFDNKLKVESAFYDYEILSSYNRLTQRLNHVPVYLGTQDTKYMWKGKLINKDNNITINFYIYDSKEGFFRDNDEIYWHIGTKNEEHSSIVAEYFANLFDTEIQERSYPWSDSYKTYFVEI